MDNRSLSQTWWECQYHIVFIPKYRKKVLYEKVREDVSEIISALCKHQNVDIIAGAVCRSCTFKRGDFAHTKYIKFYGIPKGKKYTDAR